MDDLDPLPEPDPLPLRNLIKQAVDLCTDIGLLDLIHALLSQSAAKT